jgi:hypothetical protein
MLTAVFRTRAQATTAYEYARSLGIGPDFINVLMSDTTRTRFREEEAAAKQNADSLGVEGVATGGAIGTAVGATVAAIAAIGTSVAVPGLGLVVAGPILAALAGGGAGAVTGGLIGGLIGLGIPESNARAYEEALKNGGVVIGVVPRSAEERAKLRQRFSELDGENIINV